MTVELQCMINSPCQGYCSWRTSRFLPATGDNSFPFLAGVSEGVKTWVAALVRYVGSEHNMAMVEITLSLSLSCLLIDESIGRRSLTCIL